MLEASGAEPCTLKLALMAPARTHCDLGMSDRRSNRRRRPKRAAPPPTAGLARRLSCTRRSPAVQAPKPQQFAAGLAAAFAAVTLVLAPAANAAESRADV